MAPATSFSPPRPRGEEPPGDLIVIDFGTAATFDVAKTTPAAGGPGYIFPPPKATAAEAAAPVIEKPIYVTVEPLTVNLQGEGRPKFLHMGMALKVRNAQASAQLLEYMPELRSRVLLLLSNRTPDSLMSTDDRIRLAEEIRTELNRPLGENLPAQGVVSISFNTFVVQ